MKKKSSLMNNFKISTRFMVMALVLVSVIIITISVSLVVVINIVLGDYMNNEVRVKAEVLQRNVAVMEEKVSSASDWFGGSTMLASLLRTGDRRGAVKFGQTAMRSIGFDYFVVTDTKGRVFVRAHSPEKFGDSVADQYSISKALKGEKTAGCEEGAVDRIIIKATTPLMDNGKITGAVSTGYILSSNVFPDEQKRLLGCDVTVFYGDERIATSLVADGKRLVGTKWNTGPFLMLY